ncbi:uncharacterized protein [Apostichopus japonicus]|uniref:uncharacterized protein n=1 Tax=Stichopus japonicus TaxID=307972 RepID=UPI003AB44484
MKMTISSSTVVQLGLVMALFCIIMSTAEERPKQYNRRSQGWTPQALFLYGIMPPRKQKSDVSYSTIKRTAWGPRPNIMRAWHPSRVSRDVKNFEDIEDEDDENKRAGWTGKPRLFGRQMTVKRVPEKLDGFEEFPLLKRMLEIAEKREDETPVLFDDDEELLD